MKYWPLTVSRLPANAMALYPFMLFRNKSLMADTVVINHETIHFRQQQELLILPFYIIYFLHYLFNLLKYRNHHKAYFYICFEQEAYAHDTDFNYLKSRKPYAWLHTFISSFHEEKGGKRLSNRVGKQQLP
jgi:hypothetical protein